MSSYVRTQAVMGTEFRLSARNRWVLLATLILSLFALALGFLGSGPAGPLKADALTLTAASLATLSVYLIPLLGLLLSYDTFAGELERGTLALVLATPASRLELMVGKFLGHVAVLAAAVIVGYGIAGIAIGSVHEFTAAGLWAWARLIMTSILLGAAFVAMGILISANCARTGTAAALVIGAWLIVVVLYDLALLAALILDDGGLFTTALFPWFVLANPGDAFRLFNLAALETAPVAGIDGLTRTLPFSPGLALAALGTWLAAALAAGLYCVRRIRP